MRTRNSCWLALLLTVGVALTPRGAAAQDVPPDGTLPLPLWHDRPEKGGFYAAGEFLYWRQTNPLKDQVVAIRGLLDVDGSITADLNGTVIDPTNGPPIIQPGQAVPGTFIGSGAPALDVNQISGPMSYQPGWRLTAGWKFRDGAALEFSWLNLHQTKYSAVASILPPTLQPGTLLEETFLFSPVFNFPNDYAGAINKVAFGNPLAAYGIWNAASVMHIDFTQRFTEYHITMRIPVYEAEWCRCYGLIGPQYTKFWERFRWRTVSETFDGQAGQDDVAIYSNVTSNNLWGVMVGVGSEWYLGKGFALTLDAKTSGLMNFAKESAKYERADFSTSSRRTKHVYSFVPELQGTVNMWWYPFEGVQVRVGYDWMNFFNTYSAPEPVSFNYGGLDPTWKRTYRWVDGFNAGIGFIF